ncbi:MAG: GEVED domain-containing protein, partial [Bacteroidota bacterium]
MKKFFTLLILMFLWVGYSWGQAGTYTSTTGLNGTLTDMSTGTTALLTTATYHDDDASAVTSIGFTFPYCGSTYTQFSANSNGQLRLGSTVIAGGSTTPTTGYALLLPLSGDNAIMATGKLHYKVIGTTPNQVLVVEWNMLRVNYGTSGGTGGVMQARLYETTGKIEFVYGVMWNSSTSAQSRAVCISSGAVAGANGNWTTITATPTYTTTATGVTTTSFAASSAMTNLNGTVAGSLRIFTFNQPTNPVINISATTLAFGFHAYPGSTVAQTYTISGDYLTSSPITVTAPSGYEVSLNGTTWTSSVTVSFTPPTLASTTVYARFTPLAAGTAYSGNITNAGGGATTKNVAVTGTSDLNSAYCVPTSTYGCSDGDVIARVTLNTLDNNSGTGCPSGTAGYSNYTTNPSLTTTLLPSSTYACTVWAGQYSEGYAAWIDYNDDGIFDNSTERVGYSNGTVAGSGTAGVLGSSATFPIVLACTPPAGTHRLRVRAMFSTTGVNVTPCTVNSYGEIEDYNITITGAPACESPGLATVTPAVHSASVAITLNCSAATNFDFEYGPTGFTLGTGTQLLNQPISITAGVGTFTLTGLAASTAYDVYYRANCGSATSAWSVANAFTTQVACAAPTALTATSISSSKESLSWTSGGTLFDIEWGLNGFTPTGIPTVGYTGQTNPTNLNGLTAGTTYKYYVRTDCNGSGDGYSTWAGPYSFTTACASVTDFNQNFDAVTAPAIPNCWSKYISPNWSAQTVGTYASSSHTAPNSVQLYSSGATVATDAPLLISPVITNLNSGTHQLRFFAMGASTNTSVIVGTMTDPLNSATFTPFQTITGLSTTGWNEYTISFASYGGSDQYIAFRHPLTTTYSYIYIDNVVWETIPTCIAPTAPTASNVTSSSAHLSWTDPTATLFNIKYAIGTFDPLTAGTLVSGVANPYTLSGLTPTTTYNYYVQANCGGSDLSSWAGPYSFTTQCIAISTFPWTEGFESMGTNVGSKILPACWTYENVTGTSGPYSSGTTNTYGGPNGGTNYIYTYYANTTWVFAPTMHLIAGTYYDFSFYMMNKDITSPIDFLMDVAYGTS